MRYNIQIQSDDPRACSVTFVVEVNDRGSGSRVTELAVRLGSDTLPASLASIDWPSYLRAAVELSMPASPTLDHGTAPLAEKSLQPDLLPQTPLRSDERRRKVGRGAEVVSGGVSKAAAISQATDPHTDGPSDLAGMYWRLGSVAKVAKHYGVPRRVASEWIRGLQRANVVPNGTLAKRRS